MLKHLHCIVTDENKSILINTHTKWITFLAPNEVSLSSVHYYAGLSYHTQCTYFIHTNWKLQLVSSQWAKECAIVAEDLNTPIPSVADVYNCQKINTTDVLQFSNQTLSLTRGLWYLSSMITSSLTTTTPVWVPGNCGFYCSELYYVSVGGWTLNRIATRSCCLSQNATICQWKG